jgi:hypothetical protein
MKSSNKPCLQTCWAHPESDSLVGFTKVFVEKADGYKDKKDIIKKGLALLESFEAKFNERANS